jgi:hypothetical protein
MIPKKTYWRLTGAINQDIMVNINLIKINDSLYADCSFSAAGMQYIFGSLECGKPYNFSGKMDARGNFQITPFGNKFPLLRGQYYKTGSFHGECHEGTDRKVLHFELGETYKKGSVQFNVYSLQQSVNLVKKPKSPKGNLHMAMLSPLESGNPVISDTLRKVMLKCFNNSAYTGTKPDSVLAGNFRVFKRDYLAANEDLYKKMADAGTLSWELLRFVHIVCNENFILSTYVLNYAFTGGAHGLENLDYTTIDLKTGKVLSLADIMDEGRKLDLSRLLTAKLKRMNKIPDSQKLSENGYFVDEIQPTENFYLMSSGIGFLYNHYDIAPYSSGATDIFLSADEVRDIIRPFRNGF